MGQYPNRRGNQQRTQQQMTPNEQISFEERFKRFVDDLGRYRGQVEAVLPDSIKFERFRSVIIMAIRRSPDLLDCEPTSLINACIHSAHDGLLPDGREAVIVRVWNNTTRRNEASYRSMVFGLIKQIIGSGAATKIQPFVVYKGEEFQILGGSDAKIHHVVEPDGEKRGEPIGVYAIAGLKDGESTYQYMTVAQIQEIRKIAQTDKVWAAHWEEMAIKTVIRRLRKRLAGTDQVPDVEERLMFPQFAVQQAPALGSAPPRPTRAQFEQLEDRSGTESGVSLSWSDEREKVPAGEQQQRTDAKAKSGAVERPAREDDSAFDWDGWRDSLLETIGKLGTAVDVNSRWAGERENISRAPDAVADEINEAFHDRLTDLASSGSSSGGAGPQEDGNASPAGEQA